MVSTEPQSGGSLPCSVIHPGHRDIDAQSSHPDLRVEKHRGGQAKKSKTFARSTCQCPSPELRPLSPLRRSCATCDPISDHVAQLGLRDPTGRQSSEKTFRRFGVLPE